VRAFDLLRGVEIFAPLPPPQLEWVARQARWMTFEAGEIVIAEGDAGDAYYVLETGALRVSQHGGSLRVLSQRAAGVGEIALLREVPRTATVTAETASVMLMVGRGPFLEAVTGHPQAFETARRVVGALS
jgi:CRP-like cAMP-binding protein